MIVVRAMPVVNAKARTKTTKITFTTRLLHRPTNGRVFCDRHHVTPFFTEHWRRSSKYLCSLRFWFYSFCWQLARLIEIKIRCRQSARAAYPLLSITLATIAGVRPMR